MYVYLKYDGKLEEGMTVGVGKFECQLKMDMPKEVFEKKLKKKKIQLNDTIITISNLEKIEYSMSTESVYILPIGTKIKPKTILQKIKTLYFG